MNATARAICSSCCSKAQPPRDSFPPDRCDSSVSSSGDSDDESSNARRSNPFCSRRSSTTTSCRRCYLATGRKVAVEDSGELATATNQGTATTFTPDSTVWAPSSSSGFVVVEDSEMMDESTTSCASSSSSSSSSSTTTTPPEAGAAPTTIGSSTHGPPRSSCPQHGGDGSRIPDFFVVETQNYIITPSSTSSRSTPQVATKSAGSSTITLVEPAMVVVFPDKIICGRDRVLTSRKKKSVRFVAQECVLTGRVRREGRHFTTTTGADCTAAAPRDILRNNQKNDAASTHATTSNTTTTKRTTRTPSPTKNWCRRETIWWTEAELKQIRRFCSHIVSEYRLHDGEELILAYLRLQKRTLSSDEFRHCRKTLATSYDDTRGLEHFVAKAATELQHRRYIQTVLDAQKRHRQQEELIIKQQSFHGGSSSRRSCGEGRLLEIAALAQKASLRSRQVAQRLAICDYHAAMHVHLEK